MLLDDNNKTLEDGYSVATAVMNRANRVVRCLSSWLAWERCKEIVVIDWSSRFLVKNVIKNQGINDDRVKVIRKANQKFFSRSKAWNLAIENCSREKILRIDIDYVLEDQNILNSVLSPVDSNSGFVSVRKNANLKGFCGFRQKDFLGVLGYNEDFEGWGYEDEDFYNRLVKNGIPQFHIDAPKDFLFHIPHSKRMSVVNHKCKNRKKTLKENIKKAGGDEPPWLNTFNQ